MTDRLIPYVIYINPAEFVGDSNHLKEFISQNKLVHTWWNYIPFVYVVTSRYFAGEIKNAIQKYIGKNVDVLVAEIDLTNLTGAAPSGAWKAFDKDIRIVIDPSFIPSDDADPSE